jgi:hypothetical protein
MGYPPTLGELRHSMSTRPARGEHRHVLRINVDGIELLRALDELSKHTRAASRLTWCSRSITGFPAAASTPAPNSRRH